MENVTGEANPVAPKPKKAPKPKAVKKPKVAKVAKKTVKKKPAKRKAAKKVVKKSAPKKKKTATVIERPCRLDMRLSKAERAKLVAKAKKRKQTITQVVWAAIAKLR